MTNGPAGLIEAPEFSASGSAAVRVGLVVAAAVLPLPAPCGSPAKTVNPADDSAKAVLFSTKSRDLSVALTVTRGEHLRSLPRDVWRDRPGWTRMTRVARPTGGAVSACIESRASPSESSSVVAHALGSGATQSGAVGGKRLVGGAAERARRASVGHDVAGRARDPPAADARRARATAPLTGECPRSALASGGVAFVEHAVLRQELEAGRPAERAIA